MIYLASQLNMELRFCLAQILFVSCAVFTTRSSDSCVCLNSGVTMISKKWIRIETKKYIKFMVFISSLLLKYILGSYLMHKYTCCSYILLVLLLLPWDSYPVPNFIRIGSVMSREVVTYRNICFKSTHKDCRLMFIIVA